MKATGQHRVIEKMGQYFPQRQFRTIFGNLRWKFIFYRFWGAHESYMRIMQYDTIPQARKALTEMAAEERVVEAQRRRGMVIVWEGKDHV